MPRYTCPYVSDGVLRSAVISAGSAEEAAEKMARLPWADGCGPAGRPARLHNRAALTVNSLVGLSLFTVALAASSAFIGPSGETLLSALVPWTLPG